LDPELNRRANLIVGFGFLGAIFGLIFAVFYTLIGHYWGALVVVFCSTGIALIPPLLKRGLSFQTAANLINLILIVGFTILCALESGLRGHAIAWIVSVPLCALLLLSNHPHAYLWCGLSLVVALVFVGIDFAGIRLSPRYPEQWETVVSAAGYIALILFMFLLGILFETNRKQAHQRMTRTLQDLETANRNLAKLNQEKSEFLSMAAHDIKNPLGAVIGYAEMIRDYPQSDPAETREYLANIILAAVRMHDLVINLLDVEAIEQGRVIVDLQRCSLNNLTKSVLQGNQASADRKRIRLEIDPAPKPEILIRADPSALHQILDNFISNAIKFSQPGTTIILRIDQAETHGIVEVQDQGPGLSEADQQKLFTKFARLSNLPTGNESSHGLGLAIVKRMAEAMSGTVFCRSTPGQGAVFGVRLPLDRS
jgi:signal transduction histidine kinase